MILTIDEQKTRYDKLEKLIYDTQRKYEKRYNIRYIQEDLHIQRLYLHNLLKKIRQEFYRWELENYLLKLKIFNQSRCYYLTDWFFEKLLDYNYK